MDKSIAVIGSTGSIGRSTLSVVRAHPDQFSVCALAAGQNVELMIEQALEFRPKMISMATREAVEQVRERLPFRVDIGWGDEGLDAVAAHPDADVVVLAVVGSCGLRATLTAVETGKQVALANKETLVAGGELVMRKVRQNGTPLLPVDSEHSAIFQCLNGERKNQVAKITLTASGGAFRDVDRSALGSVTVEDALNHPNWSMGKKVTIDSATMMNKGLEVIEAHWLFHLPYEQIDVVIHYESIVHSMVQFIDKAVIAQMGLPDMRVPIQYALSYPERIACEAPVLDLAQVGTLTFKPVDYERFPCLKMAYDAGRTGGTMPVVLNAANEVAVERFLGGAITFLGIERVIERVLETHDPVPPRDLETIREVEQWARAKAYEVKVKELM